MATTQPPTPHDPHQDRQEGIQPPRDRLQDALTVARIGLTILQSAHILTELLTHLP